MHLTKPKPIDYVLLVSLAAMYGASFMFTKFAVAELPALTVTAGRIGIGFAVLLVVALAFGERLPARANIWPTIIVAAFFGSALPFGLISWGQVKVDAGLAAILMATMPLCTILIAHLFTVDEKLTLNKLAGVFLGVAGVTILMGTGSLASIGDETVRQTAIAAAAVCYAVNAVVTKKLIGLPPFALAAALLFAATMMIVPLALIVDRPWNLSASLPAYGSMLVLGVLPTAMGTLMLVSIIRRQGASFLGQINFMVPLFGVFWATLFLSERLPANAWFALAVIMIGVAVARLRPNLANSGAKS